MSSYELVYQFLNPSIIDNDIKTSNLVTMKKKSTNLLYRKFLNKINKKSLIFFFFSQMNRSDKTSNDLLEIDR